MKLPANSGKPTGTRAVIIPSRLWVPATLLYTLLPLLLPATAHATDITPPTITAFGFTPTTINNTDTAPQTITVTASLADDNSGVNSFISLAFLGPSGQWISVSGSAALVSGTNTNGVFQFTDSYSISEFSEGGDWTLASINITDHAGNQTTLEQADIIAAGFPTILHLSHGYQHWNDTINWGTNDSSADADPDYDGQSNLMEFALDGDPLDNNLANVPSGQLNGTNLEFTFLRYRCEDEVTYTVQTSTNLVTWDDEFINPGNAGEYVTVSKEIPTDGRIFMRLKIVDL